MAGHRFERTDADIQRAFVRVLTEPGFENLGVSELARLSHVDRSTFYAHYGSISELAEQVVNQWIKRLRSAIEQSLEQSDSRQTNWYKVFLVNLVSQFKGQATVLQKIRLIPLGEKGFDAQCRRLCAEIYQDRLEIETNSFSSYLLVNLAMGDLDFILENRHVPEFSELSDGMKILSKISKQLFQ
ncbi:MULTISPECIES: TetR/AcrR family transcriptional regulator [Lactobacillaceae]|uniref:TetR/AcrR family transcriptional regulator n=1 Tax=Lactobacillaceae TaxID=33958 RepID=UPI0014565795|nr:TetR/AcrR family transcriptional regulator [Lactobacillus sp. HBUAS51381]NLR09193.1 TetR/AcrR family transcriptional regulator [Lactobacillus sp. HBUAS51381]